MKKISYCLLFWVFYITPVWAEVVDVALEKVVVQPHNQAMIQRGAEFFAKNCLACHTLKYLRNDPIAKKAGIVYERMPFTMKINGISPPDLSLITEARSPDWVYTYLHAFYVDPKRPSGFNNLLIPNTSMLNILAPYQGKQILLTTQPHFVYHHQVRWFDLLVPEQQGSMTPEAFDQAITDVVNFLNYAAKPYQVAQYALGKWVIAYLILFFVLTYFLKKAYWHAIKRKDQPPQ